jgi:hypothetical protein
MLVIPRLPQRAEGPAKKLKLQHPSTKEAQNNKAPKAYRCWFGV